MGRQQVACLPSFHIRLSFLALVNKLVPSFRHSEYFSKGLRVRSFFRRCATWLAEEVLSVTFGEVIVELRSSSGVRTYSCGCGRNCSDSEPLDLRVRYYTQLVSSLTFSTGHLGRREEEIKRKMTRRE